MPVVGFTVAIPGAEELHAPPGTDEKNVAPSPTQMADVPPNVPGFGGAATVTVLVAVTLPQPPAPFTV